MAKTPKLDLYAENKADYSMPKTPALLDIGQATYLSLIGRGEPAGELFQVHLQAMYAMAFTIKMTRKFAGQDYRVCQLEGIWWADGDRPLSQIPKQDWNWQILIRTPDFITQSELSEASAKLLIKKKPGQVADVKLETIAEGRCVQMLHLGPYDKVSLTIGTMEQFAADNGLRFNGREHEIYMSDPRRTAPERLKTIIRFPVCPA